MWWRHRERLRWRHEWPRCLRGSLSRSYWRIADPLRGVEIRLRDARRLSRTGKLKRLPAELLKIDQSFVQNLEESKEDRAIARTIIELGRGLGLKVLAEGVETKEQKEFIYTSGCELMQGYLFSKPISAAETEILLKNQKHML